MRAIRLLILIGVIISIISAQMFAATFEYLPVWNWKDSTIKYKVITKKYESFPDFTDRFSVMQATDLAMPVGKIGVSLGGDRLCFQSFDLKKNLSKIFILNSSSGKTAKELFDDTYNESDPVFLGDNELVYCSDKTGSPKLWKMNLQTSKTVQLTFKDSIDFSPDVFAPSGTIIFNAVFQGSDKTAICRINPTGSDYAYVCDGLMPKFSPDGKQIAFLTQAADSALIFITPSEVIKPVQLAKIMGKVKSLCWGGAGKIIFTSNIVTEKMKQNGIKSGNYNVFMIDLNSRKLYQLTDNPSAQTEAVFSGAGNCIYFNSNRGNDWNIWRMDMKDVFDLLPPEDIYVLAGDSAVALSWATKAGDKADGYNVYFKPSRGKNWWKANDEIIKTLTYTVADLKNSVSYDFKITSADQAKMMESAFSEIVSARPEAAVSQSAYDMKSSLRITDSRNGLALNWQMPENLPSFNVYYSREPDRNFKKLNDSPVFGNKFNVDINKQIIPGEKYYFMVELPGPGGESVLSNTVSGKIIRKVAKFNKVRKKTKSVPSEGSAETENNSNYNIAAKADMTAVKGQAAAAVAPTKNSGTSAVVGDEWGDVSATDW